MFISGLSMTKTTTEPFVNISVQNGEIPIAGWCHLAEEGLLYDLR
jgi:hypothetical protein